MNYGEPSAPTSVARGGLWRRGHDDGVGGGAPASLRAALWLTKLYQRALGEAVGCWGGGGVVVVMEKWRGQPVTGNGGGGPSAREQLLLRALRTAKEEPGNAKWCAGWERAVLVC